VEEGDVKAPAQATAEEECLVVEINGTVMDRIIQSLDHIKRLRDSTTPELQL